MTYRPAAGFAAGKKECERHLKNVFCTTSNDGVNVITNFSHQIILPLHQSDEVQLLMSSISFVQLMSAMEEERYITCSKIFSFCRNNYGESSSWQVISPRLKIQAQLVTVTPLGQGKIVALSNCHCKQRQFITKPIIWDMGKVSL